MDQTQKTYSDRRSELSEEAERLLTKDLPNMPDSASMRQETMLINEITLVLAEKRTSLSVMRTGLAVIALPLSVFSILIVISRYYDPDKVMYLLGPLLALCTGLAILGIYLILSALRRIQTLNRVIAVLKGQSTKLRQLCLDLKEVQKPDGDC